MVVLTEGDRDVKLLHLDSVDVRTGIGGVLLVLLLVVWVVIRLRRRWREKRLRAEQVSEYPRMAPMVEGDTTGVGRAFVAALDRDAVSARHQRAITPLCTPIVGTGFYEKPTMVAATPDDLANQGDTRELFPAGLATIPSVDPPVPGSEEGGDAVPLPAGVHDLLAYISMPFNPGGTDQDR